MKDIYQRCAKKHLYRCVADFEFRYMDRERTGFNDAERSEHALRGIVGKRLTYGGLFRTPKSLTGKGKRK